MNERRSSTTAWVTTGVVVVSGLVVLVIGLLTPVTFGWFAYQPLAEATFVPGGSGVYLSRIAIIGWVLLTIGLLAAAFLAGRRSSRRQHD
ncbi:hypothetical protein GCM10022200_10810 [Microbacterium awajiense]|uniref:Uncharacterized protein n=1 Tax=Microbacterium awajiense TaxID=415214 RepID=A0ABP7ADR9_9MICO